MKFALLLITFTVANAHFKYYNTLQSNGIIFDRISRAHSIEKYWNIVYYYDLYSMSDDIANVHTCVNQLKTLCLNSNIVCKTTIETLSEKLEQIDYDYLADTAKNEIPAEKNEEKNISETTSNERKKRNTIKEFLSETLFEKDWHKQLAQLEEKLKNSDAISQKHLTLINYTASLYNDSLETIQVHLSKLEQKLNAISNEADYQDKFDTLASYALHTVNILSKITNFIKAALINNNSINHLLKIIPLHVLSENIKSIQQQLNSHEKIPIDNDLDIVKIICHETSLKHGNLAIKIIFPIENTMEKNLYKITPIPIKLDNLFYIINPITEYAIINSGPPGYTPMTKEEYAKCISFPNSLLCPNSYPTYYDNLCEYAIFKMSKEIQKECAIRHIPSKNYITPLGEPNTYFVTI